MYKSQFETTSAIDVWGLGMTLLHILGWERNPKFLIYGDFSYSQFLSNRKVVFKELKAQFAKNWYFTQMIELLEGCLEEDPSQRLTVEQLIKKMNYINPIFQVLKNYEGMS
jgi:serine/threonine protein kinase